MSSNDIVHEITNNTSKPHLDLKEPEESSGHDNVRKSLVCRLRKDMAFRYKIKRSAAVTWSLFLVGWLKGVIGPSFPEILFLTDTPLERGSAYLTVMYTCKILGHALGGLLYDRTDKDLYSTVMPVINALVLIFPWCRTYETMIVMFGVHGLMISSMELGLITTTVNLWDREARQTYLQITMFMFSISTIVSPLAIIPFLMSNLTTVRLKSLQNITDDHNGNVTTHLKHLTKISYITNVGNQTFQNSSTLSTVDLKDQQSILYIGFAIAAVLFLSGAMPFACFFFSKRCYKTSSKDHHKLSNELSLLSKSEIEIRNDFTCEYEVAAKGDEKTAEVLLPDSSHKDIKRIVSKCDGNIGRTRALMCTQPLVIFVFIVSCVFGALHSAMEISMSDLMPTFCRNLLKWPASNATMTVSLLYFFFTVGRISCAFLVKLIGSTKVLGIFVVFIILGSVGLSVSTNVNSTPGTWVSIGVIGLGISVCYPSQLGWTSQYLVSLTGKLTAVLLCTMYIGSVIAPPLLSFLMTMYSYPFLCYSILAMSIMTFICVVFMGLYVQKVEKNQFKSSQLTRVYLVHRV